MKHNKLIVPGIALVLLLNSVGLCAEKKTQNKNPPAYLQNPMVNPTDNPELPNVLIIGDSISIGYTIPVRKMLKGKADVFRPGVNCEHSAFGVENISKWVAGRKWDVIHFNFGIWDTHYMHKGKMVLNSETNKYKIKNLYFRHTTKQYIKNLKKIIAVLKKTNAKLIFATTTPYKYYDEATKQLLINNNKMAVKLMKKEGIEIDDLYNLVLPTAMKWHISDGCHYTPCGYEQLGKQVTAIIKQNYDTKRNNPTNN
ncbi:MAG: SGNH/GDSL hydrolase family protein [Chlamydiae bacterium]|nr:MAG: SGNH/GDSL hydrolase family protein [Chlamydiota bacterium]